MNALKSEINPLNARARGASFVNPGAGYRRATTRVSFGSNGTDETLPASNRAAVSKCFVMSVCNAPDTNCSVYVNVRRSESVPAGVERIIERRARKVSSCVVNFRRERDCGFGGGASGFGSGAEDGSGSELNGFFSSVVDDMIDV